MKGIEQVQYMSNKTGVNFKGRLWSFIVTVFKGISQVIFVENALSGFIMFLAIIPFSFTLSIIALLSSCIGTLIGKLIRADESIINQGLFGYNSILTGIALTLFLAPPYNWIIALVSAAFVALFTNGFMHLMKPTKLPILTFPFIISTWFILLISYKFKIVDINLMITPLSLSRTNLNITGDLSWISGLLNGISQAFFLDSVFSGLLLIIALFCAGWRFGVYAITANFIAVITAVVFGGELPFIALGLYGYNAVLTIIAVSIVFKGEHYRFNFITGIIGAFLSVPITVIIGIFLLPYGIPMLTISFVLTAWFLIAARQLLPRL